MYFYAFHDGLWLAIAQLGEGRFPKGFKRFIYFWFGFGVGMASLW